MTYVLRLHDRMQLAGGSQHPCCSFDAMASDVTQPHGTFGAVHLAIEISDGQWAIVDEGLIPTLGKLSVGRGYTDDECLRACPRHISGKPRSRRAWRIDVARGRPSGVRSPQAEGCLTLTVFRCLQSSGDKTFEYDGHVLICAAVMLTIFRISGLGTSLDLQSPLCGC
jgi:hypothetical protein